MTDYNLTQLTTKADDAEARLTVREALNVPPGGSNFAIWADFGARKYWGMAESDLVEVRANASASDQLWSLPYGVPENTYAADTPRFHPLGLLVEPAGGANLFVNPTSVATQTITLAVGTYVLYGQFNTGAQIAITAGTGAGSAVMTDQYGVTSVSGLGTAQFGTWVKLTVTTAGTFVFTFSGGTCTYVALQSGSVPQSGIQANSVTRPYTKLSINPTLLASKINSSAITVYMEAVYFEPAAVASASHLFNISDNTNSNRMFAQRTASTGNVITRVSTSGSTTGSANFTTAFRPGVVGFNRWAMASSVALGTAFVANGQTVATGACSAMPTGLSYAYIGSDGTGAGTIFNGIITKFGISTVRESNSAMQAWTRIS